MESTVERDDVRLLATPAQVERALGISRKTLNRLVEMKVIEPIRLSPNSTGASAGRMSPDSRRRTKMADR